MSQVKKLGVVLYLLALFSCATSGINKSQFNLYSLDDEARIGNQLAQEVLGEYQKQGKIYNDQKALEYINQLGHSLVSYAPEQHFQYQFYLIKTPEVNAFALPGGHIFVFTGLISYCQNEAELAGVLAHEIGHVVARHGTERFSAMQAADIVGRIILAGLGKKVDPEIAKLAIDITATGAFLAYSRENEREADDIGARIMYQTGYHPEALVSFFNQLSQGSGKMTKFEVFLSTHPDPQDRQQRVNDLIQTLGDTESLKWDSKEFQALKVRVATIKYPEEKAQ